MRGLLASMVSLVLASCAMVGSTSLGDMAQGGCESHAGYYFLPKTQLRIEVERVKESGTNAIFHQIKLHRERVPDRRFGYCLDYLTNVASSDFVEVKKYDDSAILGLVTTDALDQTGYILKTIIRTIFVGISGDPTFASRGLLGRDADRVVVFKGELDPFDPVHSAIVNDTLKAFGFCVVLQGSFMFDAASAEPEGYCDDPKGTLRRQRVKPPQYRKSGAAPEGGADMIRGIYYRPRIPHLVQVYIKDNPDLPGGWKLRLSTAVEVENVAPIVQVGIDRAAFTQKKTTLVFDEGMLSRVCIYKKSELKGFIEIPLYLAQSIVALPATIVQVRIDQTNSHQAIVAAEEQLIKTQLHHLKVLRGEASAGPGTAANIPQRVPGTETWAPGERQPLPTSAGTAFADICPPPTLNAIGSSQIFGVPP